MGLSMVVTLPANDGGLGCGVKHGSHFACMLPVFWLLKTTIILPANNGGLGCGVKNGSHAQVDVHHWQELRQVSFLSRQRFCCDKHMFVMTYDKHVFVATRDVCFLRQKYACRNKTFVTTKLCLS